jgi:hypothetical protein
MPARQAILEQPQPHVVEAHCSLPHGLHSIQRSPAFALYGAISAQKPELEYHSEHMKDTCTSSCIKAALKGGSTIRQSPMNREQCCKLVHADSGITKVALTNSIVTHKTVPNDSDAPCLTRYTVYQESGHS